MITTRIIKSILDKDVLIVTIPQLGYEVHYKMYPTTTIDPVTKYEDNLPDTATSIRLEFIKTVKLPTAKTQEQVVELLKNESIIPPELIYDHVLLGFVYADDKDPNNHRWWLDFRDSKNQSVYHYFADTIEINCPITTKAWHDPDPNGIWHGRFVLSNNDLRNIKEPEFGKLLVNGSLKQTCKPIDKKKVCSTANMPIETESLRLRYNTREDIWFCDILDKEEKQIGQIPCKSIICDAKMYGEVTIISGRPKVSTRVNINDISEVAVAINSLIIRSN